MKSNSAKLFLNENQASREEAISNVFTFADFGKCHDVESYADIEAELRKNISAKTSTKEEKELALSYIERILKSDANAKEKAYWENQSDILTQEIREIEYKANI